MGDEQQKYVSAKVDSRLSASEYLRKAGDQGIKPMSIQVKSVFFLIFGAELIWLLTPLKSLMAVGSTAQLTITLSLTVFAVLITSIFLTSKAGSDFSRYVKARRYIQQRAESRQQEGAERYIRLVDDQGIDDDQPLWVQFANRAETNVSLIVVFTAILMLITQFSAFVVIALNGIAVGLTPAILYFLTSIAFFYLCTRHAFSGRDSKTALKVLS